MDNRRKSRLPSLGPKANNDTTNLTDFSKASHNSSIFQSAVKPLNRKSTLPFGRNQGQNIPGSLSRKSVLHNGGSITPIRSSIKRPGQPMSKLALGNNFQMSASTPRVPGLGQGYGQMVQSFGGDKENTILEGSIFHPRTPKTPNRKSGLSFNQTLNSSRYSNGNSHRPDFSRQDVPSKTDLKELDVQQDQVSQILNFIKLYGYTKECSVKDFCPPNSASMYYSIWEFLVVIIDPKFTWEPNKDVSMAKGKPPLLANQRGSAGSKGPSRIKKEELIVDYIKMIGYPHVIPSKSVFNTISQKSSWPPLLSILIYHKKLAEFSMSTTDALVADQEHADGTKFAFLKNTWLSTNMVGQISTENCHASYKNHRIQAQTEQMGTLDELEEKHDNLKADIREIELDMNVLRENNSELQIIRTEVDNLKIQAGRMQKDVDNRRLELNNLKNMNPKQEMEIMDTQIFEAHEKLTIQGEPKSKLNSILNQNNMKIKELKENLVETEEQLQELNYTSNRTGKLLDGKIHDLLNNCEYKVEDWCDGEQVADLDKLIEILGKDIFEHEGKVKVLAEKYENFKVRCQVEDEELKKSRKEWKLSFENLEFFKNHVKSRKEQKEVDVEEQMNRILEKEKLMYEEQAAQRQEAARIEKLIRQAEDQMEQELKKLSALQSKLEKEFIKIAEAGVNFSIKFKQELKILGEKLQNSSEKFQREFLVQHGIDLKLPLKMLLLNNETDASCESTRVQEK